MKSLKDQLIAKLNEVFEGTPWFGESLRSKLSEVDYQLVNKTLDHSKNSIAIIVQHLINWRVFVIQKLEGNEGFDIEMNSEEDWTMIFVENELEWKNLLKQLLETQVTILKLLDAQEDDSFLEQIVLGRRYNFDYLLEGLLQHDVYHFGQIGLLYAHFKKQTK